MLSIVLIGLFIVIILFYIKDIRDIEISDRKRKSELVLMVISVAALLGMTLMVAQVWMHYLVGALGSLIIFLEFNRRGMTSKGVIVAGELSIFGYWNRVHLVEVTKNKNIRLAITRTALYRDEVHFYDSKQYERIVAFLLNYLPEEKVRIKEKANNHSI